MSMPAATPSPTPDTPPPSTSSPASAATSAAASAAASALVSASASASSSWSGAWPSGPLDAAQRAFDLLTCPPAPLAFDGRSFEGLPQRILPLDELKQFLLREDVPRRVQDAAWRELVVRARRDGPAWVIAAVGVAMPGLRAAAGRLATGWHGDTADLDADLLTAFLARLQSVDETQPRIIGRLIDAGIREVRNSRRHDVNNDVIRIEGAGSLPPQRPWDHPDLVLARAVAAAVIGPEEQLLISATRLDDEPVAPVAARLGISTETAYTQRRAAEQRLLEAIRAGELTWTALTHRPARGRATRPAHRRVSPPPVVADYVSR
jgi:hypothetical protein